MHAPHSLALHTHLDSWTSLRVQICGDMLKSSRVLKASESGRSRPPCDCDSPNNLSKGLSDVSISPSQMLLILLASVTFFCLVSCHCSFRSFGDVVLFMYCVLRSSARILNGNYPSYHTHSVFQHSAKCPQGIEPIRSLLSSFDIP